MKTLVRLTFLSTLFVGATTAEDITVRVISAKNGHPLVEQLVHFTINRLRDPTESDQRYLPVFDARDRTDRDGKIVFHAEVRAGSIFDVTDVPDQCSPAPYRSDDVLRTGVAEENCPHRPKGKFGLPVHPGEIIIYSGDYTRLERILYLPWKW